MHINYKIFHGNKNLHDHSTPDAVFLVNINRNKKHSKNTVGIDGASKDCVTYVV
jgi:hypothetical protein